MSLWDSLKSVAGQWADASSALSRSDAIIKNLTGIDPKHFHPEVYKVVSEAANQQYNHYSRMEGKPLSDEEVAMVKLIAFCVLSKDAGQQDKLQSFGKAISTLRKTSGSKIRAAISLDATAETGF